MTVAVKTTTVRYNRPAKAAVMYDIVPLEVDLSYDPNSGTNFSGGARWQVYKIEGSVRSKMRNVLDGYVCYCGFSDDTTFEAGEGDNDSFDDDSSISGTAYNGQSMFTVRWGQLTGGVFVQLARKDFPVTIIGKNGDDAVTLDWDNEFETMQWVANEGSAGAWKNQPVSNLYIYRGEEDITKDCTVTYTLNGVTAKYKKPSVARWYSLRSGATIKGKISVLVTAINDGVDSGSVTAEYVTASGTTYTKAFKVQRQSGRYRFDLMVTPKSIGYNLTTGAATASTVTVSVMMTDAQGNRTTLNDIAVYGTLQYRHIGTGSNWSTIAATSGKSEYSITPDFSGGGVEVRFLNAGGGVEDYETVPISSVSNGGDAYTLLVASTNMAVTLTGVDHGAPTGTSTNTVQLMRNGEALNDAVYRVGGGDQTVMLSGEYQEAAVNVSGWTFMAILANKVLYINVENVASGALTSVVLNVEGLHGSNTRPARISYNAVVKGPAGRSYKPVDAGLYQEGKSYTWDDEKRDFIIYGWGEGDEKRYYKYGVKEYGKVVTVPPSVEDASDANWEFVNEFTSIITNCIFGTNAVMGGFVYTSNTMSSVKTDEKGDPLIFIDGNNGNAYFANCTLIGTIYAYRGEIGGFEIKDGNIKTKGTGTNSVNITPYSIEFSGARCNSYVGGVDNVAAAFKCEDTTLSLSLAMALQLKAKGARILNAAVDVIDGCFSGFRRQMVAFSNTGTTELTVNIVNDNNVLDNKPTEYHARSGAVILPNVSGTGKLNVILPQKPENGTEYYFKRSYGSFTIKAYKGDYINVNEQNTTKRESYAMNSSYRMLYLLYYNGMWYGNLIT